MRLCRDKYFKIIQLLQMELILGSGKMLPENVFNDFLP